MKKIIATILIMCMTLCLLGGCGTKDSETVETAGTEIVIFAAASLTESLSEIAKLYKAVAPEVTLVFNFDSSGTLKTQIEEGADCTGKQKKFAGKSSISCSSGRKSKGDWL